MIYVRNTNLNKDHVNPIGNANKIPLDEEKQEDVSTLVDNKVNEVQDLDIEASHPNLKAVSNDV